jgi:ubiquinone/menaquinone biosynthesis C-methylase UbiE
MKTATQHDHAITQSFGPQAEAYLASTVHATGKDLELLAEAISGTKDATVLDLGCGAGHASFAAAGAAREVVAYDLTEAMLRVVETAAKERGLANIRTQRGTVEKLPFADAQFDWVVSRYSAHHWRDVNAAITEMARVLKPNGQVCLIDVAGGPEPLLDTHLQTVELLRDPSHVRDDTESEWLSRFEAHGFRAEVSRRWRLPIDFASWITRIGTAADRVAAIRALWAGAPLEVCEYYALQADLSFELDVVLIRAQLAS